MNYSFSEDDEKSINNKIENYQLNAIIDSFCSDLGALGLYIEGVNETYITAIRSFDSDLADEIENEINAGRKNGYFGIGSSSYINSNVIRRIYRKRIQ